MSRKGNHLAKAWLNAWQSLTTSSRWQRGKALVDQPQAVEIAMDQKEIRGVTREPFETNRQIIQSVQPSVEQMKAMKSTLLQQPEWIVAVYAKNVEEERMPEPLRSTLLHPSFKFECTCENYDGSPCKHLIAVARAVAAEIDQDPALYIQWLGAPWEETILTLSPPQTVNERKKQDFYSLTPIPKQTQFQPLPKKQWASPPFWISPFPFPLIMEEIYSKMKSAAKEDEK